MESRNLFRNDTYTPHSVHDLTSLYSADHVHMTWADPKRTETMRSCDVVAFPQVHIAHIRPLKRLQVSSVIGRSIEDQFRSEVPGLVD